jgi:nucleoside-diphosphate-sugar epimerase
MTLLVTGAAGFVGLNIVEALLERGEDQVVLFDATELPAAFARLFESDRNRLVIEKGSVLDPDRLEALFGRHKIERVIHGAAITSGADREARDPGSVVDVNMRGTTNVLQAARKHDVRRVIYIGSGAAYGEALYRMPRLFEETPSMPMTLYSITKHAAERLCVRLKALWGLDIVCVRLGTVIGPWERDTGVRDNFGTHSQLARLAVAGEQAVLTPREIQRDWIYARDVARGVIALAHAERPRHVVYNLSSGVKWEQPIAAWCQALAEAYPAFGYRLAAQGEEPNIWYTDRDRGVMDIGRIEQDIDFRIEYPMREAYADYLSWIRRTPGFFQTAKRARTKEKAMNSVQKNPGY